MVPPVLMNGRQLPELFRVLWPLNASARVPDIGDRLDERRPGDVGYGEPGPRHRSPLALEVHAVVRIPEPELHTIGVIAHEHQLDDLLHTPQLKTRARVVCSHDLTVGSNRVDPPSTFKGETLSPSSP